MRNAVLVLIAGMAAASTANAIEIFAMNNLARANSGNPPTVLGDNLIRFDSASPGAWTTVGYSGVDNVSFGGLDFAGNGNLYAYASFATDGTAFTNWGLYSVNPGTGASTRITVGPGQQLQDLAWNPVTQQMVGINTIANVTTLYNVNLGTGLSTPIGVVSGLPAANLEVGISYDSGGNVYVHDLASDIIYRGAGLAVSSLHTIPRNTNFSQGMTIDWSRNDQGYHATIGNSPAFFTDLFTFTPLPGSYTLVGSFGFAPSGLPQVEAGDIAIRPVPAPGVLALAGVGLIVGARRRRRA